MKSLNTGGNTHDIKYWFFFYVIDNLNDAFKWRLPELKKLKLQQRFQFNSELNDTRSISQISKPTTCNLLAWTRIQLIYLDMRLDDSRRSL